MADPSHGSRARPRPLPRSIARARAPLVLNQHRDPTTVVPFGAELEQMRLALGLGVRDYVEKSGFKDVVIGISGGIDSALTAAICADALGADRVHTYRRLFEDGPRQLATWLAVGPEMETPA